MKISYKALFQLASKDDLVYKSTIRQINNLLDHLEDSVSVRIVCHGGSAGFCKSNGNIFTNEILHLINRKVVVVACAKMLEGNNLTATDLINGIAIIPSGIADLVIKQQEGWSYVKAGF